MYYTLYIRAMGQLACTSPIAANVLGTWGIRSLLCVTSIRGFWDSSPTMISQLTRLQLLYLILSASVKPCANVQGVQMFARSYLDNNRRQERLLVEMETGTLVRCVALCVRTPSCVSVFFNKLSGVCCTHSVVFGRVDVRLEGIPRVSGDVGNRFYTSANQNGLGKIWRERAILFCKFLQKYLFRYLD